MHKVCIIKCVDVAVVFRMGLIEKDQVQRVQGMGFTSQEFQSWFGR